MMMTIEEARRIWKGSDMSEDELREWVRLVNIRDKDSSLDKEHPGETKILDEYKNAQSKEHS